jgi:hypothetical protein
MSTKNATKAELERRQFGFFLNMISAGHAPSDIESREVPEPDICFQNRIAFELTEICPPEVAHTNAKLPSTGGVRLFYPTDTAEDQLTEKLNKNYVSTLPIELLCMRTSRTFWPDDHVIGEMRRVLSATLHVQFRRIWYCGDGIVEVIHNPKNLSEL